MTTYLGEVTKQILSVLFISFAIGALGYLLGAINIKGISLGTAGVLVVALLFGVLAYYVPAFSIGEVTITLFDKSTTKANYDMISKIGTALFVTAVSLIAGPKFFRSFNRKSLSYIFMGFIVISVGAVTAIVLTLIDPNLSAEMAAGLLTGALTSTPGLSAAKEAATTETGEAAVTAGYGIAYLFGVLGVVLFVQLVPKILRVDIEKEKQSFEAANAVKAKEYNGKLIQLESLGIFPFFLVIALGCIIGSIKIPGINFSLGSTGGMLIAGLVIGHFGHIGPIDCRVGKSTLNFFRELGLVLFLIGAGVPGGVEFIDNLKAIYFLYGALMTLIPMIVGFIVAKFVFKLNIFNNLGSITGGMTSTPALGALINAAGTDDVASAYAATYPVALISVVMVSKLIPMIFG